MYVILSAGVRLANFSPVYFVVRYDVFCCVQGTKAETGMDVKEGALYKLFKHVYAPLVMKREVRATVIVIFFAWLCSSIAVSIVLI